MNGSTNSECRNQVSCSGYSVSSQSVLPWGARKERQLFPPGISIDTDVKPGEYILRTLFAEFTIQTERKVDFVLAEPLERPLSKSLQRGEDAVFDQLLSAFGSVAEHCLPSLLRTLFAWYDRQGIDSGPSAEQRLRSDSKSKGEGGDRTEHDYLNERRDLAVEFIFCLVLIEVLKQLPLHPGHEDLISHIENLAFKHFKFRESSQTGPNAQNANIIADLYAEVIGVLAQSRFQSVRKRFMAELKELRTKEPTPITTHSIISLLMGMKFFRVKMVPIEEFEASFQFMQECATYFLDVKDKDIKHALAGLFVEILVPVAATVKNEVNVPCLKNFVEMLYSQTLDLCTKKKHSLALFPLVTCLLCVSQKSFFLQNWHYFLAMCLSHLKNRDPKMCRVALESLYRLLWVYMIRIKCESNTATQSRLQSIVNSLFPKGSKAVVPRDTPLNIFVKIIQFVAQERLDFAMKEIVFDLLLVGRPIKIILTPERMSIGLRAFLVVADSLQQKEGEPPMPRTVGVLPSGNTLRVKKTFLNKMLTEETAKSIGMSQYHPFVRKTFDDILRALDVQFGRPLMMTTVQNINKEPDDMITGERKPKIDLFRTCVAAIPRLIPDGMCRQELVDLLSRLTVHMDEELKGLAFQSLQNMVLDFPDWREDVIHGFIEFLLREVNDTFPQLLDNALRMLLQFLTNWKNALQSQSPNNIPKETPEQAKLEHLASVLHHVEAVALVMLCNCRTPPRRLAVHILKETKLLLKLLVPPKEGEEPVADVIDRACPAVVEKCLPYLPASEKTAVLAAPHIDLQWLSERGTPVWTSGIQDSMSESGSKTGGGSSENAEKSSMDAWTLCLMSFMDQDCTPKVCRTAVAQSWPIVYSRITTLFNHLDPNPVNDNRASILARTTTVKKVPTERDIFLNLWRNYLMYACRVAPPFTPMTVRMISPDLVMSSSPDSMGSDRLVSRSPNNSGILASNLFKQIVPLLRSEQEDMRGAVVVGLSFVNNLAIRELMEELVPYIREAIDRKQENMRRRRRRDNLRVHLARVLELIAERGTFGSSPRVLERDSNSLNTTFVEYIDGARLYLETENDKDVPSVVQEIKQHFCSFIHKLIKSFPLENQVNLLGRELRRNLFYMFAGWSGKYCEPIVSSERKFQKDVTVSDFEFSALQAMSSVLCCGPTFDPQNLSEDSHIYAWLDGMLSSDEEKVYQLGHETVVLLLEFNPDVGSLLDWLVDCCYTRPVKVADGCFSALATIFSAREYPCDHYVSIINVTLMNTGCPRACIQETALQLLQILDHRFFGNSNTLIDCDSEGFNTIEEGVILRKAAPASSNSLLSAGYPCSQLQLSRRMSHLHPLLTMPMFSEILYRFQTARSSVRQNLLQYLLPWLYNMELVDPNIPPSNPLSHLGRINDYCGGDDAIHPSAYEYHEGWGSAEATEMVLNNLFYITVKFGDEHPKEIEDLWSSLCTCWPNNLKVIIRYLFIVTGLAPNELLPHAKRVVVYLARARPEKLLDEMMAELQTVETLNCLIERTETPPFFRITSIRKGSSHSDDGASNSTHPDVCRGDLALEQGTLHTKRHSTESGSERECSAREDGSGQSSILSTPSISSLSKTDRLTPNITVLYGEESHITTSTSIEEDNFLIMTRVVEEETIKPATPQPHPLPMPEFGGYYAPLTEFLPDSSQPVTGFHRCNLALMLMTDVVVDGISVDWTAHIPLMLHIIFLGLDHTRTLVHEHCKKLLLNLLVVVAQHNDHLGVAKILLNNKTQQLGYGLSTGTTVRHNFTELCMSQKSLATCMSNQSSNSSRKSSRLSSNGKDTPVTKTGDDSTDQDLSDLKTGISAEEFIKLLIDYVAAKKGTLLWNYEDITAKVWSIKSAEQLSIFLNHVLYLFKESYPGAHIEDRWAEVSLQLALSCSSRHYAGRSLQIFRALKVPITARMLSDILSRLVETVAEQGEDMQGYVTELMLTLEASVDSLDNESKIGDIVKEFFKSTPNLNKEISRKSAPPITIVTSNLNQGSPLGPFSASKSHTRSTSYSYCGKKVPESPTYDLKDIRTRSNTDSDMRSRVNNLGRSRSAQSLKMVDEQYSQEDRLSLLAQFFWIAVSMLESDYEHEFLLALRLLEKVLTKLPLNRTECQEKLEKIHAQMKWSNFQGVHGLLLKGCTSPTTFEPTMQLLSHLTPYLDVPIVDPSESVAFPFNVMALLPYLLQHYEEPTELCIKTAENIAQLCTERSKKLENLATVMTLYSRQSFSKESLQWTKCVVKYLYDAYSHVFLNLVSFLVEVLEKGPSGMMQHILGILYCILHYLDVTASAQTINVDLLRVLAKYVEGSQWKDALKILKLVVTRSSTLAAAPSCIGLSSAAADSVSIASGSSFADSESLSKRELPGRTMEFSFDLSQTPTVGRRYQIKNGNKEKVNNNPETKADNVTASPRRSLSYNHSFTENGSVAGWRRPGMSQARTRERLIGLLTGCGQRVGLPKSPSVIFSQTSDVMDRQSSMCSSTEEVSAINNDMSIDSKLEDGAHAEQQFGIFKDFDFLEYELECQEGESMDNFNWGVRRRSLSNLEGQDENAKQKAAQNVSHSALSPRREESSDDEMGSVSPLDDHHEGPSTSTSLIFPPTSLPLLDCERRPSSPNSGSSHSLGSDGDLTLSNTSHSASPQVAVPHISLGPDDIEDIWKSHISSLMSDNSGVFAVSTYQVLSRLLKSTFRRVTHLTRESCQIIPMTDSYRVITTHLMNILDILSNQVECAYVFVDPEVFLLSHLLDKHKFCVLELKEHWETFVEKRDHVLECLDSLRSALKLEALGEHIVEGSIEEQRVDLYRSLNRLHFQLMLLLESYSKLISMLNLAARSPHVTDLSSEVTEVKQELLRAMEDTESDRFSPPSQLDLPLLSKQEAENVLRELIQGKKWGKAIKELHSFRSVFPSSSGVNGEEDDIELILGVFCRYLCEERSGYLIVTQSENDLNDVCSQLMQINLQLSSALHSVEQVLTPERDRQDGHSRRTEC